MMNNLFIQFSDDEQLSLVTVTPVTTLPLVFELSYYANVISPVFALESIAGKSNIFWILKHSWVHIIISGWLRIS